MRQLLSLLSFIFIYISQIQTQILYECNFDNATANNHCFTGLITISSFTGVVSSQVSNGALSDVTSSLKPTTNGEVCRLPYKVRNYTWDMYFCNSGYCPTASNPNSTCNPGKYGSTLVSSARSFQLKTASGGINGVDEQCLIYYYYMPPSIPTTLTVLKQEVGGVNETIDSVVRSPYNGWIKRKVSFISNAVGYRIFFNLDKPPSGQPYVGLDEISIRQGKCDDETMTDSPMTTTTATSIPVQKSETVPLATEMVVTSLSTPIPMTSTSTQIPVITSAPITDAGTSALVQTTSVISSSTTTTITVTTTTFTVSSTTTSVVQTSDFDRTTTPDETELPTSTPVTSTTTTTSTTSAEISTVQSSSTTTTTTTLSTVTIPIETSSSSTTVPIPTTTTTISEISTATTTTTTSTLKSTTTGIVDNVVVSSYDELLPREKSRIIVMATIIPILWIAFIVALIWMRRSTGVLSGLPFPFTNRSGDGGAAEASVSYELNDVSEA